MTLETQLEYAQHLFAGLDAEWFPQPTWDDAPLVPVSDQVAPNIKALLRSLAAVWANDAHNPSGIGYQDLKNYTDQQTRIATASGFWLDYAASDYFGSEITRHYNENDFNFRKRLLINLLAERGTRCALTCNLSNLTGFTPIVVEMMDTGDTGALTGSTSVATGAGATYESRQGLYIIGPSGAITDAGLNVWTLRDTGVPLGMQVFVNNNRLSGTTSPVVQLLYWNHEVWFEDSANNWYQVVSPLTQLVGTANPTLNPGDALSINGVVLNLGQSPTLQSVVQQIGGNLYQNAAIPNIQAEIDSSGRLILFNVAGGGITLLDVIGTPVEGLGLPVGITEPNYLGFSYNGTASIGDNKLLDPREFSTGTPVSYVANVTQPSYTFEDFPKVAGFALAGNDGEGGAGYLSSMELPFQLFIQAFRPVGQGVPNVAGLDSTMCGLAPDPEPFGWINGLRPPDMGYGELIAEDQVSGSVTDQDIFDMVTRSIPAGVIGWTSISDYVESNPPTSSGAYDLNFYFDSTCWAGDTLPLDTVQGNSTVLKISSSATLYQPRFAATNVTILFSLSSKLNNPIKGNTFVTIPFTVYGFFNVDPVMANLTVPFQVVSSFATNNPLGGQIGVPITLYHQIATTNSLSGTATVLPINMKMTAISQPVGITVLNIQSSIAQPANDILGQFILGSGLLGFPGGLLGISWQLGASKLGTDYGY